MPNNIDNIIDFVLRVDDLIRHQMTGTPSQLANILGISERSVYRIIGQLKRCNLPIAYCKRRKTYYYTQEGRLRIEFETAQ